MDLGEKIANIDANIQDSPAREGKNLDQAYWFIEKSKDVGEESLRVDLLKVRRKVDWRIVPVMLLCYAAAFIDKAMLNVSQERRYCTGVNESGNFP